MEVQRIDYAPRPPVYRGRRAQRLLIATVLLVVLIPLGIKCVPLAWNHVAVLYWQREALRYSPPATQIAYENSPIEVAKLAGQPDYVARGQEAFVFARPWDRFYRLLSPPGRVPMPTLFLHELTNQRGESRLVAMEGYPYSLDDAHAMLVAYPVVVECGTTFSTPHEVYCERRLLDVSKEGLSVTRRCYAGQPDPSDPSHFTIRVDVGRSTETIDGWLKDDDSVALKIREPVDRMGNHH